MVKPRIVRYKPPVQRRKIVLATLRYTIVATVVGGFLWLGKYSLDYAAPTSYTRQQHNQLNKLIDRSLAETDMSVEVAGKFMSLYPNGGGR